MRSTTGYPDMSDASNRSILRYDWATVPPAVAVVETVSERTDRDPTDLPTLNDVVDTDALNMLCNGDEANGNSITISFVYANHDVTVLGDGTVIVESIDGEQ